MIRKSRARGSSLFLLELILAILFFSLASAVCLRLLTRARLLSRQAEALSYAVSECSKAAELVNASESLSDACSLIAAQYPDCTVEEHSGAALISSMSEDGQYELSVSLSQKELFLHADISMDSPGKESAEPIYQLEIVHHLQRRKTP